MNVLYNAKIARIVSHFRPLKGILIFLLLSVVIIGGWKLLRLDDLLYSPLLPIQKFLISLQAPATYWVVNKIFLVPASFHVDTIMFKNGQALQEQPLCTALKQVIQFTLLLLIYPGPLKYKIWYLPLSWVILLVSAIIHLVILALTLAWTPSNYMLMHIYISRWFFFGMYFIIWLIWEEKFVKN